MNFSHVGFVAYSVNCPFCLSVFLVVDTLMKEHPVVVRSFDYDLLRMCMVTHGIAYINSHSAAALSFWLSACIRRVRLICCVLVLYKYFFIMLFITCLLRATAFLPVVDGQM